MSATVLLVDDDQAIRTVVARALGRDGYRVETAASLAEMRRALAADRPALVICDVVLPDGDGLEAVAALTTEQPELPVIVLSAQNTLSTAVRATEAGAYDYLPKPFDLDALGRSVAAAVSRGAGAVAGPIAAEDRALPLIGRSPAMQEVYRLIARVVATDLTVLVTGESGTGKELVARAIHDLGPRRQGPFVAINMAAIPRELIEAELFGHERGAFTGATARAAGRFAQSDGGTLFLDEIGDMPLEAQTRLLRVLQTGEFTAVGGARTERVDVRIVAATHRALDRLVADGRFREDLFYRLNVVPIALPPLRERRQDVRLLARHFLAAAADAGLPRRAISDEALALLEAHDWPGNVRELQNMVRRLAALGRDAVIAPDEVSAAIGSEGIVHSPTDGLGDAVRRRIAEIACASPAALEDGSLYDRLIEEVERALIAVMLERHGGNQLRAARAMGLNRNTLRKRLDAFALDPADRRSVAPPASGTA